MALTIGKAKSANVALGTNTGAQPTGVSTGVTLGQGAINQIPVSAGTVVNPGQAAPVNLGGVAAGPSRAQTDPLLASLASLETILANRNAQAQAEYDRAIAGYNSQDAIDRRAYEDNRFQNESNLTAGNQAALLNAANGSTGLRGVLASLNGLAGSGANVVDRLVGLAANADTGAARQNFETNATNLNQAWSQAEQNQRQRRNDASALLSNNLQNNRADVLTSRQGILQQLANTYGAGTSEGNRYASEASSLAAPIAATSRAAVGSYAPTSSLYSAGALQNYLGGTQNVQAAATPATSTAINSPVYTAGRKRDTLNGVA